MEDSSEMALTQMRKSVETLGSTTEKYGDPTLMRFLIARSMDADKAAKMFVQWQKWREFIVHLLDKTIASLSDSSCSSLSSAIKGREVGNEKLVALLDMQQLAYKNVDARGLITGFQFLQAYYPERLHKLYILNMPKFFVNVWKLISRFLEKATLDKVIIVHKQYEP
ncbi:hypothetical protein LINPERPRIM_LOCUS28419 [Linum perenne]